MAMILKNKRNDFITTEKKWIAKITRNMARDAEVNQQLTEMGWKVLRFPSKEVIKETEKVTMLTFQSNQTQVL
ncbi:DUF559 domain-containing protein [Lactobacillus delbrueckii subsp. bulgaricus]|nr:hypothetical protein [Lactobacillus delbrueckii subsp. bulgaricus]